MITYFLKKRPKKLTKKLINKSKTAEELFFCRFYVIIVMVITLNKLPDRKQNRLENYDYSREGCYFVTLCTYNRQNLFILEKPRVGNDLRVVPPLQNEIIYKWIKETENKFQNIKIEKFVIMPDHIHFIVNITERHAGRSLRDIMQFFKTMTTNDYIKNVKVSKLKPFDKKLWQKSYYDHIIRNQEDYNEKWDYIENNPKKYALKNQDN